MVKPPKSNLGPNGVILNQKEEEYRPSRRRVHTKREENKGILEWKVDEVRLRDNRPLSLKFNKKNRISPKITEKRENRLDKVTARMEQIKRELRENLTRDVEEMKSVRHNTFNERDRNSQQRYKTVTEEEKQTLHRYNTFAYGTSSKRLPDYSSRMRPNATSPSPNEYHSHNQTENFPFGQSSQKAYCSPSPNSRNKIESRKQRLKQEFGQPTHLQNEFERSKLKYHTNSYCNRESYYSPFAKEFHSRRETSQSPNFVGKRERGISRVSDLSGEINEKKRVVLTPKRKQLLEEFKHSQMK